VLVAIGAALGALLGALFPAFAADMKPLGDIFISLIKVTITPLIFWSSCRGLRRSATCAPWAGSG
jgi:Na+/H+-dicarboxylate symporter